MASVVKLIPIDGNMARQGYARVKSDLDALPPQKLLQLDVDAQRAAATVLRALPRLRALRAQLAHELPNFDLQRFDRLEDYALALSFADVAVQTATVLADSASALRSEALLEQRQRAFTLLFRVYEDARAAATFLRRHQGDAVAIAPSLSGASK